MQRHSYGKCNGNSYGKCNGNSYGKCNGNSYGKCNGNSYYPTLATEARMGHQEDCGRRVPCRHCAR